MYYNSYPFNKDERFFPFLAPFLLGGIGGAAIVAASRPRPYYPVAYPAAYPVTYPSYPVSYPMPYYRPYNYNSYSGYSYY